MNCSSEPSTTASCLAGARMRPGRPGQRNKIKGIFEAVAKQPLAGSVEVDIPRKSARGKKGKRGPGPSAPSAGRS